MSAASQFFGGSGGGNNTLIGEVLVVGGGGRGGSTAAPFPLYGPGCSGGGGAGRMEEGIVEIQKDYTYTITVGAAENSSGFGVVILGAGGAICPGVYAGNSSLGGSGSGGSVLSQSPTGGGPYAAGGNGSTLHPLGGSSIASPNTIAAYAFPGADAIPTFPAAASAGGGGGAGGAGVAGGYGPGKESSITGISSTFAVGGYGHPNIFSPLAGVAGTANTGNGGNGAKFPVTTGGAGGSGIVVVAYPTDHNAATVTGTYDEPTRSGFRVYRFTGSGTFTIPSA